MCVLNVLCVIVMNLRGLTGSVGRYGRSTASSQYLLQLAGYLGIPVIAWNADNSGLEKVGWGETEI